MPYGFLLRILGPLVIAIGLFGWGYSAGGASKQRAWDLATAAQVKAQLEASEQARATETALQAKVKEAQDARQLDKVRNDRIAAGLRASADKLRNEIAGFAGGASGDSVEACNQRAATLGTVLDSVLSDYRACTVSAETTAADLRAVVSAWPVAAQ